MSAPSVTLTETVSTPGEHAYIYRKNERFGPHITASKPFDREQRAWCITIGYRLTDGRVIHTHIYFRQRRHADKWLSVLHDLYEIES